MFEHLVDFVAEDKATPADLVDAMFETAKILESDDASIIGAAERQAAQHAFASLTTHQTQEQQRQALGTLRVPASVKHLVGMLTTYDWQFVQQAQEIRSYCVAQLLEETKNPDSRVRLTAIRLLGNVTEVALFTERREVTHRMLTEEEAEKAINDRMQKYMGLLKEVNDDQEHASSGVLQGGSGDKPSPPLREHPDEPPGEHPAA